MQSVAFTLLSSSSSSSSFPLLKPRTTTTSNPSLRARFYPIRVSSRSHDLTSSNNVSASLPRRSWSISSSSSSSFKFRPWSSVPDVSSDSETNRFEVKATSVPESAGESAESNSLRKTLELGLLFGLWYLFNIYFNIYNKQVTILFMWIFFFQIFSQNFVNYDEIGVLLYGFE